MSDILILSRNIQPKYSFVISRSNEYILGYYNFFNNSIVRLLFECLLICWFNIQWRKLQSASILKE